MAERIRTVIVTVKVDTNKRTRERRIEWGEDETLADLEMRVQNAIEELTDVE